MNIICRVVSHSPVQLTAAPDAGLKFAITVGTVDFNI